MRNALSMIFFIAGGLAIAAASLYGVYLSFSIVFDVFPAWFAYLSFMFFPVVWSGTILFWICAWRLDFILSQLFRCITRCFLVLDR